MREMRDAIKAFYARYDIFILPVVKFAIALLIFAGINNMLGYFAPLNNLFVCIILAVICAILPWGGIAVIGMIMVVLHCFGLGMEVGAFAAGLYIVTAIFYFRFVPKDTLVLLFTPVTAFLGIPCLIPVALGLLRKPIAAISGIFGMLSWYFIRMVSTSAVVWEADEELSATDILKNMMNSLFQNKELLAAIIAVAAVTILVSVIRQLSVHYSWEIAIAVGIGLYLIIYMGCSMFMDISVDLVSMLINIVVTAVAALILEFFVFSVDYRGSQYLQFEDDEYYYYVKAVPKKLSSRVNDYDEDDYDEDEDYSDEDEDYSDEDEEDEDYDEEYDSGDVEDFDDSGDSDELDEIAAKLEESLKKL